MSTEEGNVTESALLTYEQAAAYLSTPINTLRSMVHRKTVPHIRMGPRSVRFRRETLDRWLAERERVAAS